MNATDVSSDAELVRAAQAGNVESLGLLLARHQAPMRAVALSILGYGPDADDAVQEASLVALRRIGDVRTPAAISGWLRALVRNVCLMQVRSRSAVPVPDVAVLAPLSTSADPAALVEQSALRDWIWSAIGELSPTLRLPTLLRYFTDVTSYDEVAAACGIPVGTVRSRLSQARAKLSAALLATAEQAHDDVSRLTESRRREGQELLLSARRGSFESALAAQWSSRIETSWPQGHTTHGVDPWFGRWTAT